MKENKKRGNRAWPVLLLLAAVFLILYLADGDTATRYGISELLYHGGGYDAALLLLLLPLALGFGSQFYLLRRHGGRWTDALPEGIAALLLAAAEGCWLSDGLDGRILGWMIWYGAFFLFLGAALAAVLAPLLRQGRRVKIAAGALALALLALAVWFWPKNLGDKLDLVPGDEYIWYFKGEAPERVTVKRDGDELLSSLYFLKVLPAYRGPEDLLYGCKLYRLNGEYLLAAKDRGSSYVYRWSGPLEDFYDGGDSVPVWRTSSDSAIYSAIY